MRFGYPLGRWRAPVDLRSTPSGAWVRLPQDTNLVQTAITSLVLKAWSQVRALASDLGLA
ncbi:MAG: hypothetical protein ACW98K_12350 [Candidatus Kariarchaeaceae archaeon]